MRIIAIVPARGGSKGIKRKNLRFLNGKPLIYYAIDKAKNSSFIGDIIVTSDDSEILDYASTLGVKIRKRPDDLAKDDVTLDPVIYDAYNWYKDNYGSVDYVVTIQPTSPLISKITLDNAIKYTIYNDFDTVLSVTDDTHLTWRAIGEKVIPDYTDRLNRQYLGKRYKETGAFLITKEQFVTKNSRFGNKISVFEVPLEESVDIDNPVDWAISETLMKKVKILIVTFGNKHVGMGHIYRTLTLADLFIGNSVDFNLVDSNEVSKDLVRAHGFNYYNFSLEDVPNIADNYDLIINDVLDTTSGYIKKLKAKNAFVVNFEDLGEGANDANLIFNALYEKTDPPKNHKYGYRVAVVNEKFILKQPNNFNKKVKSILITFGGVDQNNLTLMSLRAIENLIKKYRINVKVILGPSYSHSDEIEKFLQKNILKTQVIVLHDVRNMALEMQNVDIGITSNGRTVYEMAAMRIPVISIAQNDRETLHTFARYNKGVKYLGIACNVDSNIINKALEELIENNKLRHRMYLSLPYEEIRKGGFRVKKEIFEEYWRWRENAFKNAE